MTALLSAEARGLLSTRTWRWGLLAAVVTGCFVSLLALAGPENLDPPLPALDTDQGTRLLLGMLGLTGFVPAMLGTIAVTSEYRHGTITFTYLFAPRRWTVLAAKLVVHALAGATYGVVAGRPRGGGPRRGRRPFRHDPRTSPRSGARAARPDRGGAGGLHRARRRAGRAVT
ncbi:hypothetical protein [Amycolatopsis cihanbeyliensis]|uniref:hypothetical protein n=1 Tax=Amycolatopsis cihanbeyliensis TaxID=1128664 RepID=UPI001B87938D|nr:hypothetical protein [Amycolatopsis cihanbeyliensis]